jgi:4-diphosphocytidyl-2-C-methyl-D-erythritol kinase
VTRQAVAVAPAKLNLHLGVGERGPDGYHPLCTVFQAVDLWERVTVTLRDAPGVRINVAGVGAPRVPRDETNLAARAARALARRAGVDVAVDIEIDKTIPVAGGLAGGSADAAATLLACDALWETGLAPDDLREVAAALGADVPFALMGGTALGRGRGETLEPLPVATDVWWVLITSDRGLATPEMFAAWDRAHGRLARGSTGVPGEVDRAGGTAGLSHAGRAGEAGSNVTPRGPAARRQLHPASPAEVGLQRPAHLIEALTRGDLPEVGRLLVNDLQPCALAAAPELGARLSAALAAGALGAVVSGSGPTIAALSASHDAAVRIAATLRSEPLACAATVARAVPGGAHPLLDEA